MKTLLSIAFVCCLVSLGGCDSDDEASSSASLGVVGNDASVTECCPASKCTQSADEAANLGAVSETKSCGGCPFSKTTDG